jgi:tricorn protease
MAPVKLLRNPTVHGDTVVFSYAGDLWSTTLSGAPAQRLTTFPGPEGMPRLSPDGQTIAFIGAYDGNGDVYTMATSGGTPKRLTYMAAGGTVLGWTPDGKYVTFASSEGTWSGAVFNRVSVDGGVPKPSFVNEISNGTLSPDGSTLAYNRGNSHTFNWRGYRGGTQGVISTFNLNTNKYAEIPTKGRANDYWPMYVGGSIYFISDRDKFTVNLFRYDVASKKTTQLTSFDDADIKNPNTDGKTIVFERDGGLYAFDIASSKVTVINPRVVHDGTNVRPQMRKLAGNIGSISLSPSGKRVMIDARGEIFSVPARNGDTRNLSNSPAARERMVQWSPDGNDVLYMSDATGEPELYIRPQRGGAAKQITSGGTIKFQSFQYSPDGKKISIQTRDGSLHVLDIATKKLVKVFTDWTGGTGSYDWSADSSYIAYISTERNLFGSTYLYRVRDGKTTRVTSGKFGDSSVAFDLSGKYLYVTSMRTVNMMPGQFEFTLNVAPGDRVYAIPLTKDITNPLTPASDEEPGKGAAPAGGPPSGAPSMDGDDEEASIAARETFGMEPATAEPAKAPAGAKPAETPAEKPKEAKKEEPKELKIDFDGLESRMFALPWGPGSYFGLVGLNGGVATFANGELVAFNFATKQPITILAAGAQQLSFNASRTMLAYQAGPVVGILPMAPGGQIGAGRVNLDAVEAVLDPRVEWKQIFEESWRYFRDNFYDPNMVGVDWNKVRKQYEAYLPQLSSRADLNYVLGLMIGEVGTGHAYVGGGDMGPFSRVTPVPVGTLGADYEFANGYVRFKNILRGEGLDSATRGPLTEPGLNVKEGDYLLEINGTKVTETMHPNELLMGKVGRVVTVKVNSKPSDTGARTINVRVIFGGQEDALRYEDWVASRSTLVDRLSNGRIGYMHIPDTSEPGMIGFIKGYYRNSDREGMIVDERFNGGGMIPTYFFEKLGRPAAASMRQRNGQDISFPTGNFEGRAVMLINEYAGSGGDMLPWLFRENKIGPLFGKRTWGGLVGIAGSAPLVDGGFLSSPSFGIYDHRTGKWIAENTGVDPDVVVDTTPEDHANQRDPQLERAVQHILDQLKKNPKPAPKRPDFPKVRR